MSILPRVGIAINAHRPEINSFFGTQFVQCEIDENEQSFPNLFLCSRFNVVDDDDGRMGEIKLNRKQPYNINTLNYRRRHCHRHTTII